MITADALSRLAPTNWSARDGVQSLGLNGRLCGKCERIGQILDAARGLLFVHVPKTGGTAVTQALVASRGGPENIAADVRVCGCRLRTWPWMPNHEHLTEFYALQVIRHCVTKAPRRIVSFAVVRDPHAVRVSAWHYLRASPDWRYAPSFNEYIESGDYERLPQDQGVYGSTFARPQSSFVGPCTLLFQYERRRCSGTFCAPSTPTSRRRPSSTPRRSRGAAADERGARDDRARLRRRLCAVARGGAAGGALDPGVRQRVVAARDTSDGVEIANQPA